jgi:hypothetical protein
MLTTNPYVIVLCLDFSKAFDTVRHSTLLEKLSQLNLPEHVYNWLANFFGGHSHCTQYRGQKSTLREITASIIQGSGIGPASYVVMAADLRPVTPGNEMNKFADDTYIVIPAANIDSRQAELRHVEEWATANNLKINPSKYAEIVFVDKRRQARFEAPPLLPGIARVPIVKILGVTITNSLSVAEHVRAVLNSCAQTLYALRVLRSHGMDDAALQAVFRSVVVSKLQYASSAWWGFTTADDRQRIEAFIRRSTCCRFAPADLPSFDELCQAADDRLFDNIRDNPNHVLHYLLPPASDASQHYNLRTRRHNYQLPQRTGHLTDCNFITRALYTDTY